VRAREASPAATPQQVRTSMQKVPQRPTSAFVNIEGSACAADVSLIRDNNDRCVFDVIATQ
jgi:hypothetical protein